MDGFHSAAILSISLHCGLPSRAWMLVSGLAAPVAPDPTATPMRRTPKSKPNASSLPVRTASLGSGVPDITADLVDVDSDQRGGRPPSLLERNGEDDVAM